MDSLANAVAGQDPVTVTGSWQRHLPAKFRDRAMEGRTAYSRWGRERGFPILYLGRPTESVVIEAYRHLVDPVEDPALRDELVPRVLATADVDVTEILDLRTATGRVAVGLSLSEIQSATDNRQAYEACQQVAAAAHQQGFQGIVVPAATQRGETLALFSSLLPAAEVPVVTNEIFWERLPDDPRQPARLQLVRDDDD
ncbi:MAG: RES domain-containing protein [Dermatophilaceae bacterium]